MNNNQKNRPDKPLFFAMIGVFFLLFAVAPAYWAFYNLGEYRRSNSSVQNLRQTSDANITPTERQEKSERITVLSSRANRYLLEMFLSGAGGFILFAIALLLFFKSFRVKNRKNIYERVDLRKISLPSSPIKIQYKNAYSILSWLLVLLFGGMFLLITYQSFSSRFITFENAVIRTILFGVPVVLFLSIFLFLQFRANKNAAVLIDNSGVKRGDGRHFAWTEFCGVVNQISFNQRTQRRFLWRSELAFAGGETVWIIPNRIKNYNEISAFLDTLPRAVLKN